MSLGSFNQTLKAKCLKLASYIKKREWLIAIVLALTLIIIGVGFGYENNKIIPSSPSPIAHYLSETKNPLNFLAEWDGANYLAIAKHGYNNVQLVNYFPLYPLSIHIVNLVVSSPLDSAVLIAWVFLVGAIYFYIKIIKLFFKVSDNLEALRATLPFVLYPTGIFLIATYTESMFAFFALGAIFFALKKRYIPAGLMTMLATATHINGILVLLLITMILIEEKTKPIRTFISFIIGSLGLVAYSIYAQIKYHNPIEYLYTQRNHGWLRHSLLSRFASFSVLDYLFLIIVLYAAIYWWKKRKSFSIYAGLYLLIPLVGGQFGGFPRYTLMVFPVPLMVYSYLRDKKFAYLAMIAITAICWTYFLLQYAGGYVGG
ncbi:MAG TPA: mannosyltransferase family protein [Candidatus Saccharimonadia bacterium]|nr:mannosyltransferase family protein [Candidatus Saccharimonadia bacterium]